MPYAPGHIPWGDLADVSSKPWIFEGSMFSVDDFRARRAKHRMHRKPKRSSHAHVTAITPNEAGHVHDARSCRSVLPTSPSFRETLVFERDITIKAHDQSKRWSLQIPAKEMNPEMVDMMLELQDLKSYFGDKLEGADGNECVSRDALVPPALVLSNSTLAIPISLDSSPSIVLEVPLAARRGKKVPELMLKDEGDEMPYPSMPTAFLGSPTSYSPTFEHPNPVDEPSMDLGEMIASLRSRCVSLGNCHSSVTKTCDGGEPLHPSRVSMASFSEDRDDDEWTFADTLTGTYGDKSFSDDTLKSNTDLEIGSPGGFETDTSVSAMDSASPKPNLQPTRARLRRPSAQNFLEPTTPPPTTPLPAKPALSPTKHVRGILKSTKNVRFASLPDEDEDKPLIAPRISVLQPVVLNPSPLRQSFEPACQEISTATIIHTAPPNTAISRATVPKTSAAPNRAPTTRRASESSALRSIIRRPSIIVSSKTSTTPQSAASSGRHSMGAKTGKQNRFRSSSTPVHPSRFVLDENTLKRAKEVNARESVSNKSRMPVAVRNIFTRFK
jgi:hypothetical protein